MLSKTGAWVKKVTKRSLILTLADNGELVYNGVMIFLGISVTQTKGGELI